MDMGQPPMQPPMDPSQMMGMDGPAEEMQEPQLPPQQEAEEEQQETDPTKYLDAALRETNLAKRFDTETKRPKLNEIAALVVEGYETDLQSCQNWLDNNKNWLKLALLYSQPKNFPWKGASNVKYPLVATAAMQFTARSYPTLVPADNMIVKTRVIGYDPDGSRADRADRIAKHMSYQVMHKMPDWEEEMDRLLFIEAIMGVCFKKTYRDQVLGTIVSKLVLPENLIVNYWARSLEACHRKTELLYLTQNEVESKLRSGEFLDIDVDWESPPSSTVAGTPQVEKPTANQLELPAESDATTPHLFLAQHTYYDLDDDGYAEPVIIIVHYDSKKVVRILPRWDSEGMHFNDKKELVSITPIEYFTDFTFIPNPDGSIYGLGFGSLLGPLNEAVNSLINQLVDAGTLNNLQSGYVAKGLRVQMKSQSFIPGEWKEINATTDDLKNSIFPLPTKEPSAVLMNLMNILIQSGNQLASVAEIFVGKMPGQNTPATTTQETVDQAMKVFTSIYKRNYRALLREFQKIYKWNRVSPEIVAEEASILNDDKLKPSDYDGQMDDIIPAADPTGNSSTAQFSKLNMLLQNQMIAGAINPQEYVMRMLKNIEIPDPEKLINTQPPPPDPKVQTEQMKQQTMAQKAQLDGQAKEQEMAMKAKVAEMEIAMKQMELEFKKQSAQMDMMLKAQGMKFDMVKQTQEQQATMQQAQLEHEVNRVKASQELTHTQNINQEKLRVAKETKALKPKPAKEGKKKGA